MFTGENNAFLTIESETEAGVLGYLVAGTIASDLSTLTLDTAHLTKIQPQTKVENMCEET